MCKSSLQYDTEVAVEGLIGITLDKKDIFLVNLNELIKNEPEDLPSKHEADSSRNYGDEMLGLQQQSSEEDFHSMSSDAGPSKRKRRRRAKDKTKTAAALASHSLGTDPFTSADPFTTTLGTVTTHSDTGTTSSQRITVQPMVQPDPFATPVDLDFDNITVKPDPDGNLPEPIPVSLIPALQFTTPPTAASGSSSFDEPPSLHSQSLPLFTSTPSQNQPVPSTSGEADGSGSNMKINLRGRPYVPGKAIELETRQFIIQELLQSGALPSQPKLPTGLAPALGRKYSVSKRAVRMLWKRYYSTGSMARKKHSGGHARTKMTDDNIEFLRSLIEENPKMKLVQMQAILKRDRNTTVSLSRISHVIRKNQMKDSSSVSND